MVHYYTGVPGLGNVALSRHAQAKAEKDRVSDAQIKNALWSGRRLNDGDSEFMEHAGLRLVLVQPKNDAGAWLVVTLYRVMGQARVR